MNSPFGHLNVDPGVIPSRGVALKLKTSSEEDKTVWLLNERHDTISRLGLDEGEDFTLLVAFEIPKNVEQFQIILPGKLCQSMNIDR